MKEAGKMLTSSKLGHRHRWEFFHKDGSKYLACILCSKIKEYKPIARRSKIKRAKKKKRSSIRILRDKLDYAFKAMIRERDRALGCISCRKGAVEQAGHLVHAGYSTRLATRWHPQNVNGQCIACNHFKSGNLLEYTLNVDEKFGRGTAARMRELSRISWKPDREALEKLLEAAKIGHEAYTEIWDFYGAKQV